MQRILLIRHGESEWNRDGLIQGFTDCDLSDLGREQSVRLRERLDLERIDVAYSSAATLRPAAISASSGRASDAAAPSLHTDGSLR